jgi:hypothetical protein
MRTQRNDITSTVEHLDLNATDDRGRAIGVRIIRTTEVYGPAPANAPCWSELEPGTWYGVRLHTTRNGQPWAASQQGYLLHTPEEREAKLAALLAGHQKRAEKARAKKG